MLQKAIQIATKAHAAQKDKAGQPYALHLFAVMEKGKTIEEKIVGIMHDLVEDTPWTLEDVRKEGFSEKIIQALDAITQKEGEPYADYLQRVKKNKIALKVKINDLENNMDIRRLQEISERDRLRLNKYLKVYRELIQLI